MKKSKNKWTLNCNAITIYCVFFFLHIVGYEASKMYYVSRTLMFNYTLGFVFRLLTWLIFGDLIGKGLTSPDELHFMAYFVQFMNHPSSPCPLVYVCVCRPKSTSGVALKVLILRSHSPCDLGSGVQPLDKVGWLVRSPVCTLPVLGLHECQLMGSRSSCLHGKLSSQTS